MVDKLFQNSYRYYQQANITIKTEKLKKKIFKKHISGKILIKFFQRERGIQSKAQ